MSACCFDVFLHCVQRSSLYPCLLSVVYNTAMVTQVYWQSGRFCMATKNKPSLEVNIQLYFTACQITYNNTRDHGDDRIVTATVTSATSLIVTKLWRVSYCFTIKNVYVSSRVHIFLKHNIMFSFVLFTSVLLYQPSQGSRDASWFTTIMRDSKLLFVATWSLVIVL